MKGPHEKPFLSPTKTPTARATGSVGEKETREREREREREIYIYIDRHREAVKENRLRTDMREVERRDER